MIVLNIVLNVSKGKFSNVLTIPIFLLALLTFFLDMFLKRQMIVGHYSRILYLSRTVEPVLHPASVDNTWCLALSYVYHETLHLHFFRWKGRS